MRVVDLPGGAKVGTFSPPPSGFDPIKANAASLRRHGYPRRPADDERLLRLWEKYVGSIRGFIVPEFKETAPRRLMPRSRRPDVVDVNLLPNFGVAIQMVAGPSTWMMGGLTVPFVDMHADDNDLIDCYLELDGNGFFQAGIEVAASDLPAGVVVTAWYQISDNETFEVAANIENFPIYIGQQLQWLLCSGAPNEPFLHLQNLATGVATSVQPVVPDSFVLAPVKASWLIAGDRDYDGPVQNPIPDFGVVDFFNTGAPVSSGATLGAGAGTIVSPPYNSDAYKIEIISDTEVRYSSISYLF